MATFKRADFGRNPHAGANRNNARARGWGSGWPNAQTSKMTTVRAAGVAVTVRREVAELVETLLLITEELGYNVRAGATWGFANRPIRGTRIASNHSWGLAVDLNSDVNPMQSTFRTDLPPKVVKVWEDCGWYWGGRYENRPDTMHFERLGTPADVPADLAKAEAILAKLRKPSAPEKPATAGKLPEFKPGTRVLTKGDRGTDVSLLQRFLGLKDHGTFDEALAKKVRDYQRMRGYEQDAAVGPITWAPILKDLGL